MASITASTKHKMSVPSTRKVATGKARTTAKKSLAKRGSVAPLMKPATLVAPAKIQELKDLGEVEQKNQVMNMCRLAMGEQILVDRSKPRAASTTRDRIGAAADIAVAAKELGMKFVLKGCEVMDEMQRMLFPEGITKTFGNDDGSAGGLKASASAVSLASLGSIGTDDMTTVTAMTTGTDSKRGKSTPANAREGSLLIIRAFCEIIGKPAEPYVVGAFIAAALDECGSNSNSVREAAEDAATALIKLANPYAFPSLIAPLLLKAMKSSEWRVKVNALDRLAQCAETAPRQVCSALPVLIPGVTGEVWDTKAQVNKAAGACLIAICKTNPNPDVGPAIPAVVKAVCKPAETNKAVSELMSTTFVVTVDAPTLSMLCPVLSRALKEKLAIHKRAACIVINNMSKLVGSPEDVAPFEGLLVPELKKVATSVQFEEIRDEALKALASLTKALGDSYKEGDEDGAEEAARLEEEKAAVEAEQKRIKEEREAEKAKEEAYRKKEEEEKRKYKEAMDAQRQLNKMAEEIARKEKEEANKKKEAARLSTKAQSGKCQGCGLKRCKKVCPFAK
mmetsp:Transcript_13051/g.36738  ORF Transcript_13051/g.36738 Transcript_13051/m.36738 type:complete len:565 (+) Transcript_13051:156-1850(+)|eukprot:CAMPEP_0172375540 /NCGR_PEP_ID=MMETSP1060-20121228/62203_1 /TAXON_ID=37318 /ORGANISM="Pseudo-nitzschia pungens, Strain cf. cingulata" /LENGTH=564 /DNA_ID=CAMNT_0013102705 /DNA_START=125 /DNA_END=1819 /DNA_ORIENTATION=-